MRIVNSTKDRDENKIEIGSRVDIFDIYTGRPLSKNIKVIGIHHQGRDGTILHFEEPPNLEFHYDCTHVAKCTRVVENIGLKREDFEMTRMMTDRKK